MYRYPLRRCGRYFHFTRDHARSAARPSAAVNFLPYGTDAARRRRPPPPRRRALVERRRKKEKRGWFNMLPTVLQYCTYYCCCCTVLYCTADVLYVQAAVKKKTGLVQHAPPWSASSMRRLKSFGELIVRASYACVHSIRIPGIPGIYQAVYLVYHTVYSRVYLLYRTEC